MKAAVRRRHHKPGGGYLTTILADNPTVLWKLDETAGTAALDSSGNNAPGLYHAPFTLSDTQLVTGQAKNTKLTGGYVDQTTDLGGLLDVGGSTNFLTIEITAKPTAVNVAAQMIATMYHNWQLRIESDGTLLWDVNNNGDMTATTAAAAMGAGVKHHLMATADWAAPRITVYIDGAQAATTAARSGSPGAGPGNVQVGAASGGGAGNVFGGPVGWFSAYRGVAFSAAKVLAHYNAWLTG